MKAFISSTYIDLVEHRKLAAEALERLGQQLGRMEVFGARPQEATKSCLSEIETCDLFIGIYAHRYGYTPSGSQVSITEAEFNHALKLNKPIFCFVIKDDHPWSPKMIEDQPGKSKLEAFKQKINEALICDIFTTPEDLAFKVAASIGRHLTLNNQLPLDRGGEVNPYIAQLRSCGDLVDLLERALTELITITRTDYNQIFLATTANDAQKLVVVADSISSHKRRYRYATLKGLIGSVFLSGRLLNARNVHERSGYFLAVPETRAELVIPISDRFVVYGAMNSEGEQVGYFTSEMCGRSSQLASALGELLNSFGWTPSTPLEKAPWIKRQPTA